MFLANMELALRSEESDEDMTAAETAPSPTKDTNGGVKYCNTMGRTSDWCALSRGSGPEKSVSFQAVTRATAPMIIGGIAMMRHPNAAT